MTSLYWRGALIMGLASLAWPLAAQTESALTLSQALDRATGSSGAEGAAGANPRLIGPQEEALAAAALVDQARLRPNPEISLEVENVAGTGDYTGLRVAEYTLSAGLPIELGGKRRARINAAQADLNVAELRRQLAGADLGFMVRERYVTAVAANARVELAPLRSLRAQAELAESEAELKAAQADALAARFALGAMWSQEPAPQVGTEFPDIQPPHELLAEYSGLETKLASAERRAAEAAIGRERSLGVPDPTVSAGVRRFDESDDNAFLVGVSIPLPLWNRNSGNVAAAEARARAAQAQERVVLADYREGKFELIELLAAADARDAIRRSLIDAREAQGRSAALLIRLASTDANAL